MVTGERGEGTQIKQICICAHAYKRGGGGHCDVCVFVVVQPRHGGERCRRRVVGVPKTRAAATTAAASRSFATVPPSCVAGPPRTRARIRAAPPPPSTRRKRTSTVTGYICTTTRCRLNDCDCPLADGAPCAPCTRGPRLASIRPGSQ